MFEIKRWDRVFKEALDILEGKFTLMSDIPEND